VLINFSQEQFRVLQFNLSVENILDQNHLMQTKTNSSKLSRYSQVDFRFSPGQIWKKLTPFFFEFNTSQSVTSWGASDRSNENYLWQIFEKRQSLFDNTQFINNYMAKNEFRPNSIIILYSIYEWNNQNNNFGLSNLYIYYNRWSEKIELKLSYDLRLILQYKQYFQNNSFNRITKYYEPSSMVEHRWSNSLQDMINVQYRIGSNQNNYLLSNLNTWLITYNIIWRKDKFLHLNRLEIRNDISAGINNTKGDFPIETYLYSTNSSLDIYPFNSAIFRFQFQYKQNNDLLIDKNSYSNIAYNIKFILRF
jgi:hypothetical protein